MRFFFFEGCRTAIRAHFRGLRTVVVKTVRAWIEEAEEGSKAKFVSVGREIEAELEGLGDGGEEEEEV